MQFFQKLSNVYSISQTLSSPHRLNDPATRTRPRTHVISHLAMSRYRSYNRAPQSDGDVWYLYLPNAQINSSLYPEASLRHKPSLLYFAKAAGYSLSSRLGIMVYISVICCDPIHVIRCIDETKKETCKTTPFFIE